MLSAFDTIANEYDKSFTNTALGRLLRERVWDLFVKSGIRGFVDSYVGISNHQITKSPNQQVLELNCGTGEDAIWLAQQGLQVLATDISPAMVEATMAKAQHTGTEERIQTRVSGFAEIVQIPQSNFDLIFSNFGGLNCIPPKELTVLGKTVFEKLQPGGKFIAVVMSRFCWQEMLYFLLKGKPREAFRRWSRKPVNARLDENTTVPTWYYSPKEFRRYFPDFQMKKVAAAGFWLPPSYLNPFFEKHPRLLRLLNFLEKNWTPAWLAWAADHFFVCLGKTNNQQPETSNP